MVKRTITITTILLILTMIVSLIIVLNKSSFAADDDIASGTYDGVDWRITADGTLVIGKEGVTQTFSDSGRGYDSWPWKNNKNSINSVVFAGTVNGRGSLSGMFYNCINIMSIDLTNFNANGVTNMNYMFLG